MKINNNVKLIYLYTFFSYLIPCYVIERLYWLEKGMTAPLVVCTEIIYAVTIVVLELPSGILADKIGRKRLLNVGAFLSCIEFILFILADSFWYFAAGVLLSGIGTSCISGALNALLYDSLIMQKREQEFEKILGRIQGLLYFNVMVAALLGSVIAEYFGMTMTYYLSFGSKLLSAIFLLFLIEPVSTKSMSQEETPLSMVQICRIAVQTFRSHRDLLSLILRVTTIAACISYVDEFWQIYMSKVQIPMISFGIISALFMIVRVPSAVVSGYLLKHMTSGKIIGISSVCISGGILYAAIIQNKSGILGIAMAFFFMELMEPVVAGEIHHKIDSSVRATIDSVQSLFEKAGATVVGLMFGAATGEEHIFRGFLVLAVICSIVACINFIYVFRKSIDK